MNELQKIIYHMRQINTLSHDCKMLIYGMFFTHKPNTQITISEPNGYEILCELAEKFNKNICVSESNDSYTYTLEIDGVEIVTSKKREITMYEELQILKKENQKLREELRLKR